MNFISAVLLAYLLGTFPSALIIVRLFSGRDVRSGGSGNMGAMNTMRMLGKYKSKSAAVAGFLLVWLMDMGKGILAVYIAQRLISDSTAALAVGTFFAILGHNYPFFLRFRGGRGAATLMGIILSRNPFAFVIWLLVIFGCMAVFEMLQRQLLKKKSSAGNFLHAAVSEQIIGRLTGELLAIYIVYRMDAALLPVVVSGTVLVILSHHRRLIKQLQQITE